MTWNDEDDEPQVHHSPDGLKVLILDGNKTMLIWYLHDIDKLTETSQTIPLESMCVAIGWFKNSENIVVAYENKFQIYNVLTPDKVVHTV